MLRIKRFDLRLGEGERDSWCSMYLAELVGAIGRPPRMYSSTAMPRRVSSTWLPIPHTRCDTNPRQRELRCLPLLKKRYSKRKRYRSVFPYIDARAQSTPPAPAARGRKKKGDTEKKKNAEQCRYRKDIPDTNQDHPTPPVSSRAS